MPNIRAIVVKICVRHSTRVWRALCALRVITVHTRRAKKRSGNSVIYMSASLGSAGTGSIAGDPGEFLPVNAARVRVSLPGGALRGRGELR